jgi:transcription antitermination factor NusG
MEKRWAVLRAQAHRETFVAQAVSSRGVECYIPVRPTVRKPGTSTVLFPGYVFAQVRSSSDDLLRIRSAPGVAYVLPRAGTPTLLPDPLIGAIRAKEQELRHPRSHEFCNGDHVRVLTGPFKWIEGIFDRRLSASGRVRILLSLADGGVAVQMAASDLEPLAARAKPAQAVSPGRVSNV